MSFDSWNFGVKFLAIFVGSLQKLDIFMNWTRLADKLYCLTLERGGSVSIYG